MNRYADSSESILECLEEVKRNKCEIQEIVNNFISGEPIMFIGNTSMNGYYIAGVYLIQNVETGLQYIGRSTNIFRRIYEHTRGKFRNIDVANLRIWLLEEEYEWGRQVELERKYMKEYQCDLNDVMYS